MKLEEYQPTEEEDLDIFDEGIERIVRVLKKMKPNQYFCVKTLNKGYCVIIKGTPHPVDIMNTSYFQNYLEMLRRRGIDVGHGDAEYGFKMPLPKKDDSQRDLIVFRRR